MKVSMIVACSENGIIGKDNDMPWRISRDLKNFRKITTGHAVVMGRKTFESIGKALPNRMNIVLSRDKNFRAENIKSVCHVEEVFSVAKDSGYEHLIIMGGGEIYRLFQSYVTYIYMTKIHAEIVGDTSLFLLNDSEWREVCCQLFTAELDDTHDFSFIELEKWVSNVSE